MEKSARKGSKSADIARLPITHKEKTDPGHSFLSREELLSFLKGAGFVPTPRLGGQLKIPSYVVRGKYERIEFSDTRSVQPFPYHDSDSPARCADSGSSPPSWVKTWYMAIIDEEGSREIVLFYRPKNVFVKCRLDQAENVIPAEMYRRTIEGSQD